jgi:NAD(P)-dependent dehydrogenase (short-subunit alcohol dehydrogenase family)
MNEAGRVAVITGAGSGIGRVTSRTLLDAGYRVALAGRRPDALEETIADRQDGDRAIVVPTDVSDPDAVSALFARVEAEFGRVDVLFNNAGAFGSRVTVDEVPLDVWQHVVNVNLTGSFLCAQHAMRIMKRQEPQGGRIINNGSISAHSPRPFAAAYTATKHAITGLTKQISLEGRPHRIACSQIDIGNAATDMTTAMSVGIPQADGSVRAEPRMSVDDVARAVLYMSELPLEANVQFMMIMATNMPYIARG